MTTTNSMAYYHTEKINALRDNAMPSINGATSSFKMSAVQTNHFEFKFFGSIVREMVQQTMQFGKLSQKERNMYIANFLKICNTFKYNGVTNNDIHLTLRDKAKIWLNSLPPVVITTCEELAQRFLAKYFPITKIAKLRNYITTLTQFENDSLYETWEWNKDLLKSVLIMSYQHGSDPNFL